MTDTAQKISEAEKMATFHGEMLERWQSRLRELKAYQDNLRKGKGDDAGRS